jgi:hypothetical protein
MARFALSFSRIRHWQAVFAVLSLLVASMAFAQDDPPTQAGRISWISGTVSIQPVGTQDWGQAYPNLTIGPGDRIFTDSDGRAEIQVGQTYVRIGPNTDVSLVDDTQFAINFGVAQGSIRVHTFGLWPRQLLDVSTPNGNAEFEQSGDLRADVYPTDGATVFTNLGQFADITGAGQFRQGLDYGQSLQVSGTNPVYSQWLQPADPDDLDAWSQQRDQEIARAASYQYVSPDVPGAADLDTYGSWEPQTEYGAVWYPNNVPVDWAPYHYGHWVNHAPWGWVWVEDEPWGYAPFHYGRWVWYHARWGWIPGPVAVRPVYSPALVVFAGGVHVGGAGVSAWFPLGPGEVYRPWYRCSPRYIDQVNITNIRESNRVHVQNTYVNVVNVTNVTYINQSRGVTAMRQEDFVAGRSGRNAAVRIDVREMEHVQPIAQPQLPPPTQQSFISRPAAHPVHVATQRPTVINQQGQFIAAKPGAAPIQPPVRPIAPARPLPGRTVVAAPVRVAPVPPAGRPVPPAQGRQEQTPNPTAPVYTGGQQPRPTPVVPVQPGLRPITAVDGKQDPRQNQPNQAGQPSTVNPGAQVPRANPVAPIQPGIRPIPSNGNQQDRNLNSPNQNGPSVQPPAPGRQEYGPAQPDRHRDENPYQPQGRSNNPPPVQTAPPVDRQAQPAAPPASRQEYWPPQQSKPNNQHEQQQKKNDDKNQPKSEKKDDKKHHGQ